MGSLVLGFQEVGTSQLQLVGGKGFNLAELTKIQGIQVPQGFCITTAGYQRAIEKDAALQVLIHQLTMFKVEDREQISVISRKIRQTIENVEIPPDLAEAVTDHLSLFGEEYAYAVRSSATAEDLPHASFAGQQDSY